MKKQEANPKGTPPVFVVVNRLSVQLCVRWDRPGRFGISCGDAL